MPPKSIGVLCTTRTRPITPITQTASKNLLPIYGFYELISSRQLLRRAYEDITDSRIIVHNNFRVRGR